MVERIAECVARLGVQVIIRTHVATTISVFDAIKKAEIFKGKVASIAVDPQAVMGRYYWVYSYDVETDVYAKISGRQSEGVVKVA